MEKEKPLLERYFEGSRAFELDLLRGSAILLMVLHHLAFDLHILFGIEALAVEGSFWVRQVIRPFVVMIFLGLSGISSTFSRSNVKRGSRLLFLSLLLTAATAVSNVAILKGHGVIYFNVLHTISLSTLIYALLTRREGPDTEEEKRAVTDALLVFLSALILYYGLELPALPETESLHKIWFLPFGYYPRGLNITDYMPLLPWSAFYFLGAVIGRRVYRVRKSRFPNVSRTSLRWLRPLLFCGRHALAIYLIHQPVIYFALLGLDRSFHLFG